MINTLHHQNRACYINKELGLTPRIPIVRKVAAPKVAKVGKKTAPEEAKKDGSVLEGLLFKTTTPSATSSTSKVNDYRLIEAIKQIPAKVFFKNETDKDGKLVVPITSKVLNNYVYKMIGEKIPLQQISLKYVAPNGIFVPVEELDFVGNYVITFTVPSYNAVNKEVKVVSTNLGQEAQQKMVRS